MINEDKLTAASNTIGQHFLMLVQALSGIRALTTISIDIEDEEDLLRHTLDVLNQNLDFERCSIFLANEQQELHCIAGMAWEDKKESPEQHRNPSHVFKFGEGVIGHVANTKQLYHARDCKTDELFLHVIQAGVNRNIGSLICVPIISAGELLGVLNISHPEPEFFHTWQEHVFNIHADILAQLLFNHRLMRNMASQVELRTRELKRSLQETEELKSRYQALSVVDDLTQIYNRRYFFSEVPAALSRAIRYQQSLHLLFIDLDHFKLVNDTYGHETGDRVLQDVASILSERSRQGDILARLGGEEFALAVPNSDTSGVRLLANRIRESVAERQWKYNGESVGITLSIGISELKLPESNQHSSLNHVNEIIHVLVREADQALYLCKQRGRNTVIFYNELNSGPTGLAEKAHIKTGNFACRNSD